MQLTGKNIVEYLHNHVCYRMVDGFVHPLRYTEYQVDHLSAFSEAQGLRALAGANITLEFTTDSLNLGIDIRFIPGSSRKFGAVDLLIDGKLSDSFQFEEPKQYKIDFKLPEGKKKVTVHLPWSMQSEIKEVSLDDGCLLEKTTRSRTIICIGDSITQGYITDNPSLSYVGRLNTLLDADLINQGNGGYFLDAEELDPDFPIHPDLVTFAYGTNDYSKNDDIEVIRGNLIRFLDKMTTVFPKIPVICITPPYRGGEKYANRALALGWDYKQLIPMFHEVCANYRQVSVIDDTVPHDAEFYAPDYVHPNSNGFEHYFNNLLPEVEKRLFLKTNAEKTQEFPKNKPLNVLFIGNSFVYTSTHKHDLPGMLSAFCKEYGYENVRFDSVTVGGFTLEQHCKDIDKKFAQSPYDLVVIQEQSLRPVVDYAKFHDAALTLVGKAHENGAKVLFYETWGYAKGFADMESRGWTTAQMECRLAEAYTKVANETKSDIIYCGLAMLDMYTKDPSAPLYDSDLKHLGLGGSYLVALSFFKHLFNADLSRLKTKPEGLSQEYADKIKAQAKTLLF